MIQQRSPRPNHGSNVQRQTDAPAFPRGTAADQSWAGPSKAAMVADAELSRRGQPWATRKSSDTTISAAAWHAARASAIATRAVAKDEALHSRGSTADAEPLEKVTVRPQSRSEAKASWSRTRVAGSGAASWTSSQHVQLPRRQQHNLSWPQNSNPLQQSGTNEAEGRPPASRWTRATPLTGNALARAVLQQQYATPGMTKRFHQLQQQQQQPMANAGAMAWGAGMGWMGSIPLQMSWNSGLDPWQGGGRAWDTSPQSFSQGSSTPQQGVASPAASQAPTADCLRPTLPSQGIPAVSQPTAGSNDQAASPHDAGTSMLTAGAHARTAGAGGFAGTGQSDVSEAEADATSLSDMDVASEKSPASTSEQRRREDAERRRLLRATLDAELPLRKALLQWRARDVAGSAAVEGAARLRGKATAAAQAEGGIPEAADGDAGGKPSVAAAEPVIAGAPGKPIDAIATLMQGQPVPADVARTLLSGASPAQPALEPSRFTALPSRQDVVKATEAVKQLAADSATAEFALKARHSDAASSLLAAKSAAAEQRSARERTRAAVEALRRVYAPLVQPAPASLGAGRWATSTSAGTGIGAGKLDKPLVVRPLERVLNGTTPAQSQRAAVIARESAVKAAFAEIRGWMAVAVIGRGCDNLCGGKSAVAEAHALGWLMHRSRGVVGVACLNRASEPQGVAGAFATLVEGVQAIAKAPWAVGSQRCSQSTSASLRLTVGTNEQRVDEGLLLHLRGRHLSVKWRLDWYTSAGGLSSIGDTARRLAFPPMALTGHDAETSSVASDEVAARVRDAIASEMAAPNVVEASRWHAGAETALPDPRLGIAGAEDGPFGPQLHHEAAPWRSTPGTWTLAARTDAAVAMALGARAIAPDFTTGAELAHDLSFAPRYIASTAWTSGDKQSPFFPGTGPDAFTRQLISAQEEAQQGDAMAQPSHGAGEGEGAHSRPSLSAASAPAKRARLRKEPGGAAVPEDDGAPVPWTDEQVAGVEAALAATLAFIARDTPISLRDAARADSLTRAKVCRASAAVLPRPRPRSKLAPPVDTLVSTAHPASGQSSSLERHQARAAWQVRCALADGASLEALALLKEAIARPASTPRGWLRAQERSAEAGGLLWSGNEVLVFLFRFIMHPKDFERIARYLPRRTPADCASLYYRIKHVAELKLALRRFRQGVRRREGRTGLQCAAECASKLGLRVPAGWWLNKPSPVTEAYRDGVPVQMRHGNGPYTSLLAQLVPGASEEEAHWVSATQQGELPQIAYCRANAAHWTSVFGSQPLYQ